MEAGKRIRGHVRGFSSSSIFGRQDKNQQLRRVTAFSSGLDYRGNEVCTTHYRWYNFLPLNLYKQFHRLANWFFVGMLILNWVPQLNAVGKYFSITPLLIVLATDAIKDLYEDIRRGRQDDQLNDRETHYYSRKRQNWVKKKWRELAVGDVLKVYCKEEIPADLLIIDSTDESGFAFADTSTLDGETNLKSKTVARVPNYEETGIRGLQAEIYVDQPNNDLSKLNGYMVDGGGTRSSLCLDNFILRGSQLRNCDHIVGLVIYAGHDTKAMKNSRGVRRKMSKIERTMNGVVLFVMLMMFAVCAVCAFGQWLWLRTYDTDFPLNVTRSSAGGYNVSEEEEEDDEGIWFKPPPYVGKTQNNVGYVAFLSFFTFAIVYNQLIPMSLYIVLEMTKVIQIWFIRQDLELFGKSPILCRSMSIAEDLGQVQYIFSDKTGTLTENKMVFKAVSVCSRLFGSLEMGLADGVGGETDEGQAERPPVDPDLAAILTDDSEEFSAARELLVAMALCNTVMVTTEGRRGTSFSQYLPRDFKTIVYEAESPDELSLVNAAREYGFILLRRTPESCVMRHQSTIMRYKVLCTLPFDSKRKCMSIIVVHPRTSKMVLFTKGADTAMFGRLRKAVDKDEIHHRATTLEHINTFAKKGMRTLAIGYKILEPAEYQQFIMRFRQASTKMDGREEAVSKACSSVEQHLTLLGGTGVEDKLQEGVPEVLTSLRSAGIVVWLLTGDKQETAVSIGYSSQLYTRDTNLIKIKTTTYEATRAKLTSYMALTPTGQVHKQALVISGNAIEFLLHKSLLADFMSLCQTCQTVICCRTTPLQKSLIVTTIRDQLKVLTLAIGDGANDVGMLRQADIGIGIAGREGTQAVMASDFAIEQFRMLRKLVLVHGHWTYHRISDFMFYFFYKNIFFTMLILLYQFFNGFSGSYPLEEFIFVTFNTFWTQPGTLVSFSMNQYSGTAEQILADPSTYGTGRRSETFTMPHQVLHMLEAVYHGALVFSVASMNAWDSPVGQMEFSGVLAVLAITTMNVNFLVRSPNITLVLLCTVLGTLTIGFTWLYFYGMIPILYKFFRMDPHFSFSVAVRDPTTWANLLLILILAFLPRLLITVLNSCRPEYRLKGPSELWKRLSYHRTKFEPIEVTEPGVQGAPTVITDTDANC